MALSFDDIPDNRADGTSDLRKIQLVQLRLLKIIDRICRHENIDYWLDFGTLLGAMRHKGFIPWDDDLDIGMTREGFNQLCAAAPSLLGDAAFLQTSVSDRYYDMCQVPAKLRDNNSVFIEDAASRYHQGIFIDIFPYDRSFADHKKRYRHQRLYKNLIEGYRQNIVKKSIPWYHETRLRKALLSFVYRFVSVDTVEHWALSQWKKADRWGWRTTLSFKTDDHCYPEETMFPLKEVAFEDGMFFAPADTDYHLKTLYGNWPQLPPPDDRRPVHCVYVDVFTPCGWREDTGCDAGRFC